MVNRPHSPQNHKYPETVRPNGKKIPGRLGVFLSSFTKPVRGEWSTTFLLLTFVFFGRAAAAAIDPLAGCITFVVFAGGVIVLVFYSSRRNGRWATPYLSLYWVILPTSFTPYLYRNTTRYTSTPADFTMLGLALVGGLSVSTSIRQR